MTKPLAFLAVALLIGVSLNGCAAPTRTNDPSALPETKQPHSDGLQRSDPNTSAEDNPNPSRPSGGPGTMGGGN